MGKKIDLTKQKFGRLEVIEEAGRSKDRRVLWKCVCDCGKIVVVIGRSLRNGATKSCGCLSIEKFKERSITHGMSTTSIYYTWQNMLKRCNNPKDPGYPGYGGRDIKVCKRWLKFENFLEDMGERLDGLTIERIDNNKGYYKGNCKWATHTEQSRNRRMSKNNISGVTGVHWSRNQQSYCAQIGADGRRVHIGCFANLQDATTARKQAELKYWDKERV